MTVAQNIRRVALRTASVLLAVGLVVAATYAMTPSYDPKRAEAAEAKQAKKHPPSPGSEEALRRVIDETQRGQPDYARMNKNLSHVLRRQLPQAERLLARLGPLQSIAYLGKDSQNDRYRVTFLNGSLLGGISIGKSGIIERLRFAAPRRSPQDWIDGYAAFSMRERAKRMATQFAILLAATAFGRFALRLRL
jgi:hypothetical protein